MNRTGLVFTGPGTGPEFIFVRSGPVWKLRDKNIFRYRVPGNFDTCKTFIQTFSQQNVLHVNETSLPRRIVDLKYRIPSRRVECSRRCMTYEKYLASPPPKDTEKHSVL